MHPWKKIIRGNTEDLETKACFTCLERIQDSHDDIELKLHLFKVHSVKVNLKELVEMCTEAEEREEREGWSLDDILKEEKDRREADARKRAESGGWMVELLRWKNRKPECLDSNAEAETSEVNCFLCLEKVIVKSCEYNNHLEKQHGIIFGVKDIKKADKSKKEPDLGYGKAEQEISSRTDADTVKELVEMKFLPKKGKKD